MAINTTIMYGEPIATLIKQQTTAKVQYLRKMHGITPKLVALLIGSDPVSRTYVDLKKNDCAEVGIISEVVDMSSLPKEEAPFKIVETIERLNEDDSVNAVIPQMPFDHKISEEIVFSTLSPNKDADGMTPHRLGKLLRKEYTYETGLLPCTPKGAVLLAKYYNVQIEGADVAIVGRSTLVGEPARKLFQDLDATATCYHTASKNLKNKLASADIIVAASGRPPELFGQDGFRLTGDMVKEGSTVIAVGVRKDPSTGKMLFDTDTKSLKGKCSFVSPNTGGVGMMTRAVLIQNTVIATEIQLEIRKK